MDEQTKNDVESGEPFRWFYREIARLIDQGIGLLPLDTQPTARSSVVESVTPLLAEIEDLQAIGQGWLDMRPQCQALLTRAQNYVEKCREKSVDK